jgi:molybdate transport system ATP-binding protein
VVAIVNGLVAQFVALRSAEFRLELDVRAEPGSTMALLGPNGAGKSTAVWAIAGVVPIHEGRVTLAGRVLENTASRIRLPPEERRLGAVFQDVLLFPHLSVVGNVAFAIRREGSRSTAHRMAMEWLDRLGIADLAEAMPRRISGGQAQLVGLARALAAAPDLLLLDEPLAALDVANRAQVRHLLAEHMRSFAGPRLLITHDPAEAFILADRVAVIEEGRITQEGTPDEIRRSPRTRYAADLAGLNLIAGVAANGMVRVDGGPGLTIADAGVAGPVLLTIHPRAVSIHPIRPAGSHRNAWPATVAAVETIGDRCRVQFSAPLPLTAEITVAARDELELRPHLTAWVAIKAAEIEVRPN